MCWPAQEKRHVKIEKSLFYYNKIVVFVVQLLRVFDSQTPPSLPFGVWVSEIPVFVVFYFLRSSNQHARRGGREGKGKTGQPGIGNCHIRNAKIIVLL